MVKAAFQDQRTFPASQQSLTHKSVHLVGPLAWVYLDFFRQQRSALRGNHSGSSSQLTSMTGRCGAFLVSPHAPSPGTNKVRDGPIASPWP